MSPSPWHLFLDDFVLARSTGFRRLVHHPRSCGVVIPADRPWETAGVSPIHVGRRPDGTFYAHYTAMWWDIEHGHQQPGSFAADRAHHMLQGIACAESPDGIHWHKPELGLAEGPAGVDRQRCHPFPAPVGRSRANNLGVPFVVVADLGQHGNVADPARRFALRLVQDPHQEHKVGAAWQESPRGFFAAEVPDFRHDAAWRERLQDAGSSFDPRRHLLHFWDAEHGEWVALEQGVVPHWLPSREVARFASPDLVHWTSDAVLYPDARDACRPDCFDEPMGMVPFCAEGVVFGLLSWFHSDRTHPDGGPTLEPTPEHPERWPWCRKGTNEMRITQSRDGGRTWDRTSSRQAWIPHGTEEDSFDRLVIGPHPPLRVGDEDWFYVGVIDGDHLGIRNNPGQDAYYRHRLPRHQVALYVQQRNRFVSLQAGHQPQVLITRPVEVAGGRLQLNVDASRGRVRVGVAAAGPVATFGGSTPSAAAHLKEEHLLPGFGFGDGEPVCADSTECAVRFGRADLAALRGGTVHLLFEVADADLYGFRFVE
ncbi:MAG: hypothetical protein AB1505_14870 [Candidatus Latescibacterota bacterium]